MIADKIDKVEYYVDGTLFGYTYYGKDSYEDGRNLWDNDNSAFFVGVCPWQITR